MKNYTVRPYKKEDIPDIVETVHQVYIEYDLGWYPDDYHSDLYHIDRDFPADKAAFFVAELNGKVVGCGGVQYYHPLPGKPGELVTIDNLNRIAASDCSLERIYVRPSARKIGIGSQLTLQCIKAAKKQGCSIMEIWNDKLFTDATRLYQKLGAQLIGDRIGYDPDSSQEWGLFLNLKMTPQSKY